MNNSQTLIIGGGIAGSSLAIHLIQKGQKVTVLDRGVNFSTNVAAGMVNPIVFRRMNLSWNLETFYPFAVNFYQELEKKTNQPLIQFIKIRRLFSSPSEMDLWNEKIKLDSYKPYLNPINHSDRHFNQTKCPFGSGTANAFWVDSKAFYKYSHELIQKNGQLLIEDFDQNHFNSTKLSYKSRPYERIIFCTGYENHKNTLFNFVPVQTTKGQLITIQSDTLPNQESLNRKCFAIPRESNSFLIGATYEWNNTSLHTDEKGRKDLEQKFSYITDDCFEITHQEAGIRPTMLDRRPVLGEHPTHKNIFIFNGLGTKGFLMAPFLAEQLALNIIENKPIEKEIHISRFIE